MQGRKRDYQFIVVGENVYFSCDMNISKVANSNNSNQQSSDSGSIWKLNSNSNLRSSGSGLIDCSVKNGLLPCLECIH